MKWKGSKMSEYEEGCQSCDVIKIINIYLQSKGAIAVQGGQSSPPPPPKCVSYKAVSEWTSLAHSLWKVCAHL